MSNCLEYLSIKGLDKQWLIDQRVKYKLTFKQIGDILGISRRVVAKLCNHCGLQPAVGVKIHSNDQLLSALKQALQELGYLNCDRYDVWAIRNKKPRANTIVKRFLSFDAALKMIGARREDTPPIVKYSEEQIKYYLTLLSKRFNRPLVESDIDINCPFGHRLLEARYGGTNKALLYFGLISTKTIHCRDCDKDVEISKYCSPKRELCSDCQLARKMDNLELWMQLNPEKAATRRKRWYQKHPDRASEQHKLWWIKQKQKYGIGSIRSKIYQNLVAGIISEFYPSATIIQEQTWPWLINPKTNHHLWADIYVPEMNLVVEYHGKHHYQIYPPYTRDEKQLAHKQYLDSTKEKLCRANGLRFAVIPYNVGISKSVIYNLLHIVYIKRNSHIEEFGIPYNRKAGDVGYDLHASHDLTIHPNEHVNIGTEVYLDMPYDVYASILLRSGMAKKGLMTHQSLIDPGFRGELKVMIWNFSSDSVIVEKGERIAQMLFSTKTFVSLVPTDTLSSSERGTTGFGSSGL